MPKTTQVLLFGALGELATLLVSNVALTINSVKRGVHVMTNFCITQPAVLKPPAVLLFYINYNCGHKGHYRPAHWSHSKEQILFAQSIFLRKVTRSFSIFPNCTFKLTLQLREGSNLHGEAFLSSAVNTVGLFSNPSTPPNNRLFLSDINSRY